MKAYILRSLPVARRPNPGLAMIYAIKNIDGFFIIITRLFKYFGDCFTTMWVLKCQ